MIVENLNGTAESRLTKSEKMKMIFYCSLLFLFASVCAAFSVLMIILAGFRFYTIAGALFLAPLVTALLIYCGKYTADFIKGEADVFEGVVEDIDMDGSNSPVCFMKIGYLTHHVSYFSCMNVKAGNRVRLRKATVSKKVLSVTVLE